MPTLDTRIISGKGILLVNKDEGNFKIAKVLTLTAEVIRKPTNEYLNFNYNPPQSRYATLTFLRGDSVIAVKTLDFPRQAWDFYPDISAQVQYAVQCSYAGILETFYNLGNALSLPSISLEDHIKDWRHIDLFFDTVKVVCYGSTAIRLTLASASYDVCEEQFSPTPSPPPPPPAPPPVIPIDTSLEETEYPVSPPYDDDTDNGDFDPYPGDYDPVEPGEDTGDTVQGNIYQVIYHVKQFPGGSVLTRSGIYVFGVAGGIRFASGSKVVECYCCGIVPNPYSPPSTPDPLGWVAINVEDTTAVDLELVDLVPFP